MRTVALTLFLILSAISAVAAAGLGGVLEPLIGAAPASALEGRFAKWRGDVLALSALGTDVWRTTKAASVERAVEAGAPTGDQGAACRIFSGSDARPGP